MLIDPRALAVLKKLNKNNIEAYIVGGAVRDYLLNKRPQDYDICYNAEIKELYKIFKGHKIYETGIKYGTITLNYNGLLIELTRFRTEKGYADSRHPTKVSFVNEIKEDLLRRDFTINALALNYKGEITDEFGGKGDLEKGIIKAVGNPKERFTEDALRILRAYRFAARFDFKIEEGTKRAIEEEKEGLKALSKERVTAEIKEILKGKYFYKIFDEFLSAISPIINTEKTEKERLSELLSASSEKLKFPLFVAFLDCENSLRLSNNEQKTVDALKPFLTAKVVEIAPLFLDYNLEETALIFELLELQNAISPEQKAAYCRIIKKGLYKKSQRLKIDGNDLMNLGFLGKEITKIKTDLMLLILQEKIKNKKSVLIKYVKENYK